MCYYMLHGESSPLNSGSLTGGHIGQPVNKRRKRGLVM